MLHSLFPKIHPKKMSRTLSGASVASSEHIWKVKMTATNCSNDGRGTRSVVTNAIAFAGLKAHTHAQEGRDLNLQPSDWQPDGCSAAKSVAMSSHQSDQIFPGLVLRCHHKWKNTTPPPPLPGPPNARLCLLWQIFFASIHVISTCHINFEHNFIAMN